MKLIAALLTLMFLGGFCRADQVTDLVKQIPVRDTQAENALSARLMEGGVAAIKELCGQLLPLGTEGKDDVATRDTQTRDAISGLVRYVGRKDGEADRATLVKGLCESLSAANDAEVKTFIINRLQDVGHDDAVSTLAPLLADEKLGLHACAALERIGTSAATEAIAKALPEAKGAHRIAIIKSLGMLNATGAANEIRKSATDDDKNIRLAALWSLANLGDASVNNLLTRELQQAKGDYEKTRLYDWALLDARRLAEAGKKKEGAEICTALIGKTMIEHPIHVQCAAAWSLARIDGEAALETLLPLIDRDNAQLRAAVLAALAKTPGDHVTAALVGRLKSITTPASKAEIAWALGARHDEAARPALLEATKDADAAVRLAALKALVALGRDEAIGALVDRITHDDDAAGVAKPAAEMLALIPGDKPLSAAAAALPEAPAKSRVALLELLTMRAARGQGEAVLKQASDADPAVRAAALKAMEKVARPQDAQPLIELAIAAKDGGEASSAIKAAAAASLQSDDAQARTAPWLAALKNAQGAKRAAVERGLAKIGGAEALDIVVKDLKSDDKVAREGALDALTEWQDSSAVAPLLEVAKGDNAAQQVTAIRGVVDVLKHSPTASSAEKVAAYAQALSIAKRPEEKKMILGALGNERGEQAFELAASTLDQPGLQAEASLAVIKTALPQGKGQPGLTGAKVAAALKQAIPQCPDGGLKADANRYLKTLGAK